MSGKKRRRGGSGGRWLALAVLAVLLGGAAAWVARQPYAGFAGEAFVDFERGMGASGMARELAEAGVIRSRWEFLAVRALRPRARLQAGEYRFREPAPVWTVFDRIARGDVFYYDLVVPEGANLFDVAARVGRLGFIAEEKFLKAARNPGPIRDLAPGAPTLEGYLFPSTYRLTRRTTADQLAKLMTDQFRKRWAELKAPAGTKVNRLVTLAAIVEKETGLAADRGRIASVYANRLEEGMKLEADPTTIYAALLEGTYDGKIHKSDLANPHPYNTYRHAGLPPGPIANPGMASLKAALHPPRTDYLYFVAKPDGSGGSNFSRTLAEHAGFAKLYRQSRK